jgi:hypothetical protein
MITSTTISSMRVKPRWAACRKDFMKVGSEVH